VLEQARRLAPAGSRIQLVEVAVRSRVRTRRLWQVDDEVARY
jgi:hypothetical protein